MSNLSNENLKPKLLELVTSVHVDGIKEFKAKDFFTEQNKLVKITYIGNNFTNNFLSKVEKDVEAIDIKLHKLLRPSLDIEILSEIGSGSYIRLAHLASLLKLQPNGEKGAVLTNVWASIFYIKDVMEVPWAVRPRWYGGGWYVGAYSIGDSSGWRGGYLVGSR